VLFTRVLQHTHGHQAQASELLGLNRSTLRHRLKTLGLAVDRAVTDAPPGG
jgi:two-component system, NtrC family, nitrogen regulation response regulator GlnG